VDFIAAPVKDTSKIFNYTFAAEMSPSVDAIESQWRAQLQAMRSAIDELKNTIKESELESVQYGEPLNLDAYPSDDDDDFWDLISDEDEGSSDFIQREAHAADLSSTGSGTVYDIGWLARQCLQAAQRGAGLDSHALQEQVLAVLASDSSSMRQPKN
jgi:antiviral helicase SLH1